MGGIRTTGDLVARMQLTRKMRLPQAKRYVADKLGVSVRDLTDSTLMRRLREELDYHREAKHAALYRAMLAGEAAIRVPETLPELSTNRLLTMNWLEGWPLLSFLEHDLEDRNGFAVSDDIMEANLDDGRALRTHLRMHGAWHLYRPGEEWQKPARSARSKSSACCATSTLRCTCRCATRTRRG